MLASTGLRIDISEIFIAVTLRLVARDLSDHVDRLVREENLHTTEEGGRRFTGDSARPMC